MLNERLVLEYDTTHIGRSPLLLEVDGDSLDISFPLAAKWVYVAEAVRDVQLAVLLAVYFVVKCPWLDNPESARLVVLYYVACGMIASTVSLLAVIGRVNKYRRFRNVPRMLHLSPDRLVYSYPGFWQVRMEAWPRSMISGVRLIKSRDIFARPPRLALIVDFQNSPHRAFRLRTRDPDVPDRIVSELQRILAPGPA